MVYYNADYHGKEAHANATILIKNCTVLTMNPARQIIPNGCVKIEGSSISYVGEEASYRLRSEAEGVEQIIDGRGGILLPGFIDSHAHAGHGLTKTLGEGGVGISQGWDAQMEQLYFQGTTPEFWRAEAYLAGLEKLTSGITLGLSMFGSYPRFDDPENWAAHVEAMAEVGIRDILGIGPPNPPYPKTFRKWKKDGTCREYELTHRDALQKTKEGVAQYHACSEGRILCYPTPSAIGKREGLSLEEHILQNEEMLKISDEYGVPIHAHSYGGDISFTYRHSPFILRKGVSLAHCTGISTEEVQILAQTGVAVCSGPCTTAYILNRCPVIELLEAGCTVAFCSDASAPDRTFDLFEKMRVGIRLQRVHFRDPNILPAGKALEMVTIDAAKALGLDHLVGSIEVGKKADLILLNMEKPHLYPLWQEPLRVVYQAYPQDVDTVIVDGRVLMKNRRVSHLDEEAILHRSQEEAWKALKRVGLEEMAGLPKTLWKATHY
jgi:cytosine/adenosine deaminase-related metal-dependent hydrolase